MQFIVARELLLKLLKQVSGIVEKRAADNPVWGHILLVANSDRLEIYALGPAVELSTTIELDVVLQGSALVPFRQFFDICKALPATQPISLDARDSKLYIEAKNSKFTLNTLAVDSFPSLSMFQAHEVLADFSLPKSSLILLISKTAFAMAEQDVRYYFNGMLLECDGNNLISVAADGHRLAKNSITLEHVAPPFRIIIPRRSVLELSRLIVDSSQEQIQIKLVKNYIQFKLQDVCFSSKLLEGKFPDYTRVVARQQGCTFSAKRDSLKEAFTRASALFNEKFKGVRIKLGNNSLKVLASNAEHDNAEEDIQIEYTGQELEVGYNIKYLIDFLSVIVADTVQFTFNEQNQSTLIETSNPDDGAYVLMPVRM